jgi:hypothetical protein
MECRTRLASKGLGGPTEPNLRSVTSQCNIFSNRWVKFCRDSNRKPQESLGNSGMKTSSPTKTLSQKKFGISDGPAPEHLSVKKETEFSEYKLYQTAGSENPEGIPVRGIETLTTAEKDSLKSRLHSFSENLIKYFPRKIKSNRKSMQSL